MKAEARREQQREEAREEREKVLATKQAKRIADKEK
jgi:hypothetical protein